MTTGRDAGMGSTASKLCLLGSLYLSQGPPYGFFIQALPVLLRKRGFSLGEIGLTSLLAVPWALEFLWAPLVDRYSIARVGRRKAWIVPLQLTNAVILGVLASSSRAESPTARVAVYAGTFDPIARGHPSAIERGARLFDRLHVSRHCPAEIASRPRARIGATPPATREAAHV